MGHTRKPSRKSKSHSKLHKSRQLSLLESSAKSYQRLSLKQAKAKNLSHGGELRKTRWGRGLRPLSPKDPLHLVFKVNKSRLQLKSLRHPKCFSLIHVILNKWSHYFGVKVEQISIQVDHIHLLVRSSNRYQYLDFFRVMSGQIAQCFEKEGYLKVTHTPQDQGQPGTGLWKHRPFTRVVKGWKGYQIIRNYIQLNEKEAQGVIPYRKERLKGMSMRDWELLWT